MQRTELIDDKIAAATEGLNPEFRTHFSKMSTANMLSLADYISGMRSEVNPSDNYRKNIIKVVSLLSRFHKNKLSFKTMARKNIVSFLDHLRKPDNQDPKHKWMGTYNLYITVLTKFFKWLFNPDIPPKTRPKPEAVQNIPQLKRKEISNYSPDDLWTEEDDRIFLKYCPSKRMQFYHTIARDVSNRPHEVLKLKVGDIKWKLTPDKKQYAEVSLSGKTGKRQVPLFHSIPFVKDYLDHEHPQGSNLDAPLFCGLGKKLGKRIGIDRLRGIYVKEYQRQYFPKLLQEDIPEEDKDIITALLRKPWNPYIRRHTGLTEKSKKIPALMNQYAGWTPNSKMPQKYFHYFSNESSNGLLEAYGYVSKDKETDVLKPKYCPNCNEGNKPDSKFCANVKCRMVLSYDGYTEAIQDENKKNEEIAGLKSQMSQMQEMIMDMREQGMFNTRRRLEDELRSDPNNEHLKIGLEKHKETAKRLLKEGLMREGFYAVG
jgi:integrase/recombinase XerD